MLDPISWAHSWPFLLSALLFGYILGSFPTGMILTKLAGTKNLRDIGSGNIGATNVLRTGRKDLAALTLIGDGLKGFLAVWLANSYYGPDIAVCAAVGAFFGHLFPIWLKFKGGKGVATFLGILLGLAWQTGLVFIISWLVIAAIFRFSSLSALIASVVATIFTFILGDQQFAQLFALLTLLLWIMHRQNITRLLSGTESKIGKS